MKTKSSAFFFGAAVRRAGAILAQVLVIAVLLITIVTAAIHWQLQRYQAITKQANQTKLVGTVSGGNAVITRCLAAAGYPSGTCIPNAAQSACIPAGTAVTFSGTPPSCKLKITATN